MKLSSRTISERLRELYSIWNNPPSPELPDGASLLLNAAEHIDTLQSMLTELARDARAAHDRVAQLERRIEKLSTC